MKKRVLLFLLIVISFSAVVPAAVLAPNSNGVYIIPPEDTPPIADVTVKNAMQWNEFARHYNENAHAYADPLTISVEGQLNFGGLDFVPLRRPFSGTIRGKLEVVEGYTEETVWRETIAPGSYPSHGGHGFFNVTSVEETAGETVKVYSAESGFTLTRAAQPNLDDYIHGRPVEIDGETMRHEVEISEGKFGLFGTRCGDLTLENLVFVNIRPEKLRHVIAKSVDLLTVRNVEIAGCSFQQTSALLACNAGRVEVDNLLVSRYDGTILTCGGGLFTWVYENAAFARIGVLLTNVRLLPDSGGSGYGAGAAGLLVSRVGGNVSFSQIEVYNSSVYSLNSVALCHTYGSISKLSDITIRSSSFLGFPANNAFTGLPYNSMLFGGTVPPFGNNVLMQDSMFNVYGSFEDYRPAGYVIDNCIDVTFET